MHRGRWHYLGVLITMLHVSAMAEWLGGRALVVLSSPNSCLDQPDAVNVTIQDPSRGVDPIAIDVVKAGASHVISNSATFPYAATWRMVVTARYGFNEVKFTADVKIV